MESYRQPGASEKDDSKTKRNGVIIIVLIILVIAFLARGQIHDMIYPAHQAPAADG